MAPAGFQGSESDREQPSILLTPLLHVHPLYHPLANLSPKNLNFLPVGHRTGDDPKLCPYPKEGAPLGSHQHVEEGSRAVYSSLQRDFLWRGFSQDPAFG